MHSYIQGVSLTNRQTLRGNRNEDKCFYMGNHGEQTSSAGARGHLKFEV